MVKFKTEVVVGLFVIVTIGLLVWMSLQVSNDEVTAGDGVVIEAVFDTAAGLKKRVPVVIAGIDVGIIEDIRLAGDKAVVSMRIRKDIQLPADSTAIIRTAGVLGDKYIELRPGSTSAPAIEAGQRLTSTQTPADMDVLFSKLGAISDDIKVVTESLSQVFGGAQGEDRLNQIMNDLENSTSQVSQMLSANRANIDTFMKSMASFSQDLEELSSGNKDDIKAILATFRATSEQLASTMDAVSQIAEKVNTGQGALGSLVNDESITQDLKSTLAALREVSEKMNQGQGALGALVNDDKAGQDLKETVASVQEITDKINKGYGTLGRLINDEDTIDMLDETLSGLNNFLFKTESIKLFVDYHTDYFLRAEEAKTHVNIRLQPREDRYYLLGVVDDPIGKYSKKTTTETTGGISTTTVTEEWDASAFKFNLQFAKRYRSLVLRAGLIESSAGVGADYYFLDGRLHLTAEAYDFSADKLNPHLKVGASLDFLNFFYLNAGYDNFLNKGQESAYVGFGLRFNDDDLKYLLSSVPLPQ